MRDLPHITADNVQPQWLTRSRQRLAVILLLGIHAGLLAYSATQHSPTHLEPAFLASGISHWQFGRFELYRVNPPLPRMIAALPVMAWGCKTDWSRYYEGPGSRAEFPVGEDFIKVNGPMSIPLFFMARWACIPFSLIGGYFAYRWANELYGNGAGLVTLFLWTFEPNLLAHAELVTPDCACWSFGIVAGYTFWRWLKQPTWGRALLAGGALGLAELTKLTWIILFGLWPALWLAWIVLGQRASRGAADESPGLEAAPFRRPTFRQLAAILLLAVYVLNLGYAFDGFGTRLKEFQFVSTSLTGREKAGTPGNRFRESVLASLPLPLPRQYVLGFDIQRKDLEAFPERSYLRGEWRDGGWWYYYLYGLLVKVPSGVWGLLGMVALVRVTGSQRQFLLCDEVVLLLPAAVLLVIVSSHTTFNIHLRYVFPAVATLLVYLGQSWFRASSSPNASLAKLPTIVLLSYSLFCSLRAYPHHLAYFNEFVGGPRYGSQHLLGSSVDWGQDWLLLLKNEQHCGIPAYCHCAMPYSPGDLLGVNFRPVSDLFYTASAVSGNNIIFNVSYVSWARSRQCPSGPVAELVRQTANDGSLVGCSLRVIPVPSRHDQASQFLHPTPAGIVE